MLCNFHHPPVISSLHSKCSSQQPFLKCFNLHSPIMYDTVSYSYEIASVLTVHLRTFFCSLKVLYTKNTELCMCTCVHTCVYVCVGAEF